MRTLLSLLIVLTVATFVAPEGAAGAASSSNVCGTGDASSAQWRASALLNYWVNGNTRDVLGSGYGLEVERSFGNLWVGICRAWSVIGVSHTITVALATR